MNSFLAGALAGTAGAAGKYEQVQKDQMEFNQKQQAAAAEDLRKRNFARYNYEMKDLYGGSGMVDESGRELSKKELQDNPNIVSMPAHQWNQKQADIQAGKKEELYQQHRGEKQEDAIAMAEVRDEYAMDREDRKVKAKKGEGALKASAAEKKAEKKLVSNFSKDVQKDASKNDDGSIGAQLNSALNFMDYSENPEVLAKSSLGQKMVQLDNLVSVATAMRQEDGKGVQEIKDEMKADGVPAKQIEEVIEVMLYRGTLETGEGIFRRGKFKGKD